MTRNEARGVALLASLEKRRDFLRCARGRKAVRRAFVLQMAAKPALASDDPVRLGYTASRKVGGAVQRNRAKRRLRAAARAVMPGAVVPGFDYVLVARGAVLTCPYAELEATLRAAMTELTAESTKARARAAGPSARAAPPVSAAAVSPPSTAL